MKEKDLPTARRIITLGAGFINQTLANGLGSLSSVSARLVWHLKAHRGQSRFQRRRRPLVDARRRNIRHAEMKRRVRLTNLSWQLFSTIITLPQIFFINTVLV